MLVDHSHVVYCLGSGAFTAMPRFQFPAWENSNSVQGMPFIPCFHSRNCVLVLLKFCYDHHFSLGAANNVAK
jgi:hypothetical protein